jgi:hypothetical protein
MLARYLLAALLLSMLPSLSALAAEPTPPDETGTADDAAGEVMLSEQERAAEDLYTARPTGDALWDKYTEAMLWMLEWPALHTYMGGTDEPSEEELASELAEATTDEERGFVYIAYAKIENPPRLPDEVLAFWEPEFGKDPRYWQLRYWNAWQYNDKLEQGDPDPERFLREGKAKGATDAATDWLLVREQLEELSPAETAEELEANYQAQLALLDAFTTAYPDESIGWYKRALLLADFGSFKNCLEDLEAGNATENNRELDVFPYSFVADCVTHEKPVGSKPVAGAVILSDSMREHEQLLRGADQFFKNAQVVLAMAGSTDILETLFHYAMRVSMRDGASDASRMAGTSGIATLAKNLLVEDFPDRTQKAALLRLRDRVISINMRLSSPLFSESHGPDFLTEYLPEHFGKEVASLKFSYEDLAMALIAPTSMTPKDPSLGGYMGNWPEMNMAWTMWPYEAMSVRSMAPLAHYKVIYDWAVERRGPKAMKRLADLENIAKFDMTTLSWPETDADAGA